MKPSTTSDACPDLACALDDWRRLLGPAAVVTDAGRLGAAATATFATTQRIPAMLQPGTVAELQACLRIAQHRRVPVYAVSTGRNWGLGSRVPPTDGCVMIELARLDRIRHHDEALGTLTVETGVSFLAAHAFLEQQGSRLWLPVIGGPPESSIVANTAERGDGEGPSGDRAAHVAALEVVLPDGELLHTGFDRFEGAAAARLNRFGVGPSLDGLFMQSNLGIITALTLHMVPRPAVYQGFSGRVSDFDGLVRLVDALRGLIAEGVVAGNCVTVWNAYKVLAGGGRYPFARMHDRTPFSLLDTMGAEPWFCAGSLSAATPALGAAQRAFVEERLAGVVEELRFFDADNPPPTRPDFVPGVPRPDNLRTAYWRKRFDPPAEMDLDRDRCGVLWLCPAFPMRGGEVAHAMREVRRIGFDAGFEAHVGMNPTSMRALNCYVSLMYDRDVPGEDARALACHDAMAECLMRLGHLPYRLGVQSMQMLPPSRGAHDQVLRAIRQAVDPAGIMAPGRYLR